MIYFWTALTMIFVVIEFATVQLVTIWFALGSIAALFVCSLRAPLYLQIIVFLAASTLFMLLTRPLTSVKIDGNVWSARSEDGEPIASGQRVRVLKIDGVKLIVKDEETEKQDASEKVS